MIEIMDLKMPKSYFLITANGTLTALKSLVNFNQGDSTEVDCRLDKTFVFIVQHTVMETRAMY